jgi:5'-3' exonuclease
MIGIILCARCRWITALAEINKDIAGQLPSCLKNLKNIMPPTLYLVDGHALAYRMYFALAFDTGKTFRDDIYPEYKATRAKMPDDLRPQIERIRQLVDTFNIPRLEMEGYEADDVLGSAAKIAAGQGLGVKIVTGDRDLLQLVNQRTAVYLAGDDQNYITEQDVFKKLGVRPDQVVDYKAIVGDKSDNIPGVAGVGEKTAIALLEKFGTLEGIYKNIEQVENRWKNKLEAGKESAYQIGPGARQIHRTGYYRSLPGAGSVLHGA